MHVSMRARDPQSPPRLAAAVRALTLTLLHTLDTLEPSAKAALSAALKLRRWRPGRAATAAVFAGASSDDASCSSGASQAARWRGVV